MGLFKKDLIFPEPRPTRLDEEWFMAWARGVVGKVGSDSAQRWRNELEGVTWMLEKANGVIDHDFRDYVQRYCSPAALKEYLRFYASAEVTPWNLISVASTLQPDKLDEWETFLVDDAEQKLTRFAGIIIDPSIVQ